MSGFEELKVTFFEETSELLVQLEAGLNEIQTRTTTEDTVHAIFRAVHSIKGGAGVFGFEQLIDFAHAFETVLDEVRKDALPTTSEVVDILLRANDTLADLVSAAREDRELPKTFGSECREALELLLGGNMAEAESGGDIEGLDFTPVRFDGSDVDEPVPTRFEFRVAPRASLLTSGIDLGFAFESLRALGQLDLVPDETGLPPFDVFDPANVYLRWTGSLDTIASRDDIEIVLAAVAEHCDLDVSEPPAASFDMSFDDDAAWSQPMPDEAPIALADDASVREPTVTHEPLALVARAMAPIAPTSTPVAAPPAPVATPVPPPPPAAKGVAARPEPQDDPNPDQRPTAGAAKAGGATTIRVELDKIDRVVNMVGELVIAQAMLGQVMEDLPEEVSGRVADILNDLVRHTRGLKDSVMAIRAQPVSSVFQRMPRLVRELSMKTGKRVQIETFGENTEVDKTIIERLSDPLTHIIRNSIDHGIESPSDRLARGKAECGTIRLAADQRGGRIVIEISDDGAGINCERVLKKARDRGLVDAGANLSDEEICNLIFLPGFSTAETVSDISGRGVGMDVVRRNIQDIGGRTSIKSEAGRGMTIQLTLPLTLAVMDGMVVSVDRQTYVLPIPNIVECLRPSRDDIRGLLGTSGTLQLRGDIVPLVHLGELLGVHAPDRGQNAGIVIISEAADGTRLGLVADELCGHQQVVIKSIEENCGAVLGIAGATILGDGHVAFILDVEALSEMTTVEPRSTTQARHPGGGRARMVA